MWDNIILAIVWLTLSFGVFSWIAVALNLPDENFWWQLISGLMIGICIGGTILFLRNGLDFSGIIHDLKRVRFALGWFTFACLSMSLLHFAERWDGSTSPVIVGVVIVLMLGGILGSTANLLGDGEQEAVSAGIKRLTKYLVQHREVRLMVRMSFGDWFVFVWPVGIYSVIRLWDLIAGSPLGAVKLGFGFLQIHLVLGLGMWWAVTGEVGKPTNWTTLFPVFWIGAALFYWGCIEALFLPFEMCRKRN